MHSLELRHERTHAVRIEGAPRKLGALPHSVRLQAVQAVKLSLQSILSDLVECEPREECISLYQLPTCREPSISDLEMNKQYQEGS